MSPKNGPSKTRYVAATQSLLVLCTVGAALVPAATLISLDVVKQSPVGAGSTQQAVNPAGALAAYTKAALTPSKVDAAPVDPTIREIPLTGATPATPAGVAGGGAAGAGTTRSRATTLYKAETTRSATLARPASRTNVITSTPQPVTGYGTVGLTWEHGDNLTESQVKAQIRWEKNGVWSAWKKLEYHDDHGPDAGSAEAKRERPGTMEALVGHVAEVQTRLTVTGAPVPPDLKLAVIDPGTTKTAVEAPAIDTGRMDPASATPDAMTSRVPGVVGGVKTDAIPAADGGSASGSTSGSTSGLAPASDTTAAPVSGTDTGTTTGTTTGALGSAEQAALSAAAYTPKPQIYSRAQWGADESLRDKPSLHYGEIHGGFIHHTVNANDYTRAEVPGIIRSIYAYHVKARGWSDIGYNFLIDRFGRIWEGRYGGVNRPVVGAHTENYNDWSFGVSAIGNYQIARPSNALIQSEGALFAWKLSLHGVSAAATNVRIGPRVFSSSIMGHRDTKATECPGQYLYARIPDIRRLAAGLQAGWAARQLQHNVVGASYPDLIVRRASNKMGYVIPTGGVVGFDPPVVANSKVASSARAFVSPDLTGDGVADMVEVSAAGVVSVVPGHASGVIGGRWITSPAKLFAHTTMLTAVGDLNGDRFNDLVGRDSVTGWPVVFRGNGKGHFTRHTLSHGPALNKINLLAGTGDVTGDGKNDLIARGASGALWILTGDGAGGFTKVLKAWGNWSQYKSITGYGDYTGDGIGDLIVRYPNGASAIRAGTGKGSFVQALGSFPRTASYGSVLGGVQLVGNAYPDLLVRKGSTISVLPNSGHFDLGKPIATGVKLSAANLILNVGDFNGDGHGDMVVRRANGDLYLYLGKGNGRFGSASLLATGFGSVTGLAAVGDVTGDGAPDLQGRIGKGGIYIWPARRGPNRLGAPIFSHVAIAGQQIAAGTWTTDGAPDSIYRSGNTLTLYPGDGPGGLTAGAQRVLTRTFSGYSAGWVLGVGPLSAGSNTPVLVARNAKGQLYGLWRGPSSTLGKPVFLGSGLAGYDLVG